MFILNLIKYSGIPHWHNFQNIIKIVSWKMMLTAYTDSEGSDQPAQSLLESSDTDEYTDGERLFWSDCVDAQAELSWAELSVSALGIFSHDKAQSLIPIQYKRYFEISKLST